MTEKDMIVALLKHPAGYDIDILGMRCGRSVDGWTYSVNYEPTGRPDPRNWEKSFDRPEEAVEYFLAKRQEMKIGIDLQVTGLRQEQRVRQVRPVVPSQPAAERQPSSKPQGL